MSEYRYEKFENEVSAPPDVQYPCGEAPLQQPMLQPPTHQQPTLQQPTLQQPTLQQPLPQYPGQPHSYAMQQPPVYGQQPPVYGQVPARQTIMHVVTNTDVAPKNYFGLALFVTLCCCLPLGIVGLVKSSEVNNRMAAGDFTGAYQSSEQARRYSLIGLGIGIVIIIVNSVLVVMYGGLLKSSSENLYDPYNN